MRLKERLSFSETYRKLRDMPHPLLSRLGAGAFTIARTAPLKALAIDVPRITETAKQFERQHPALSKIAELGTYYAVGFTFVEYANEFARYLDTQNVPYPYENAYTAVFSVPIVSNAIMAVWKSLKETSGRLSKLPCRIISTAKKILEKGDFATFSLVSAAIDIPIIWGFVRLINEVAGDSIQSISSFRAMAALAAAILFGVVVDYIGITMVWTRLVKRHMPCGGLADFVKGFAETFSLRHIFRQFRDILSDAKVMRKREPKTEIGLPESLTAMQHAGRLAGLSESYFLYVQSIRLATGFAIGWFTVSPQRDFVEKYYSVYAAYGVSTTIDVIVSFNSAHLRSVLDDPVEPIRVSTPPSPSGTA